MGEELIVIDVKDLVDAANNIKTQELRALETFFYAEAEQVYSQIREVVAFRLYNDIKVVVEKLGSVERLRYLHPQDVRGFMRALYVELAVGNLLGRLHTLRQAGAEKEFASITGSFEVPFEEAVRFMRSLVPMTREEYDRLSQELKFRAFTIARVFSLDVLSRIRERYIKAVERGETIKDMMRFLDETLDKVGVSPRNPFWLETHARNNFLTAYNAGRWAQIAKARTIRYLVYNAILDERTTKLCKSLDGVVRPKDDPFWDRFMPPNHHNCRSLVTVVKNEFAYMKRIKSTSEKKIKRFEKLVEENEDLKRQFQFRASPVKSLVSVPDSVYRRAKEYGILREVIEFNLRTKSREEWLRELRSSGISERRLSKKFEKHKRDFVRYWGKAVSAEDYMKFVEETLKEPKIIYAKLHKVGTGRVFSFTLFKPFHTASGKKLWFLVGKTGDEVRTAHPVPEDKLRFILEGLEEEGAVRWK